MQYVYKIKHKFVKEKVYSGKREIEDFGFLAYNSEEDDEIIYALGIKLRVDSLLSLNTIKILEQIYKHADENQRKEDFSEYVFDEVINENGEKSFKLNVNEKNEKEFTECQLCFSINGKFANTLFINAPDGMEYYDAKVLNENIKEIIQVLLKNKVIYKARSFVKWKEVKK